MTRRVTHRRRRFVVEGVGQFPLSMLWSDNAVPETEAAALRIQFTTSERRQVSLVRYYRPDQHAAPNERRWLSFLWGVVSVDKDDLEPSSGP